ncbi:MAG TPA: hypothetical protein VEI02_14915, partial [Planctomycetota bacterium]|nr:hypothetical protein [Planctomycetota bacterium]
MKKASPAVKAAVKLLVGFGVAALVASQVKLDDELTLRRADGTTEAVRGRDLHLEGEVFLDPTFDAGGAVVGGAWSAPAEEASVVRDGGTYAVTRRGADGKPETRTGSAIGWRGTARLRVRADGGDAERTWPLQSREVSVATREDGEGPVRVALDAKHGLLASGRRLFDRPDLVVAA